MINIRHLLFVILLSFHGFNLKAQCVAGFQTIISGNEVSFLDTSSGSPSLWTWNFGDGNSSPDQFPIHSFLTADSFLVCLKVEDLSTSCFDSICQWVAIPCQAAFTQQIFSDNSASFSDLSFGPADSWWWDFGDGTLDSVQNPSHVYELTGLYSVCLTIVDSSEICTSTICENVNMPCSAGFMVATLPGNNIQFTDSSFGNSVSWQWDFGDGETDTAQNPLHTFDQTGSYLVCLTIHDSALSCFASYCDTVDVPCQGDFNYTMTFGDTVFFESNVLGNPVSWHWDFGDGDTSNLQNPVHAFPSDSIWIVCLTWTDSSGNCAGTFCDSVPVGINTDSCSASFDYTLIGFNFISFTNFSDSVGVVYLWDFGDGTTSSQQDPFHLFPSADVYEVCLTVMDPSTWCFDTFCMTVDLTSGPSCDAAFDFNQDFNEFNFQNLSTGANFTTQWNWTFGDGGTATDANPSHIYALPGNYEVCLSFINPLPPLCVSNSFCLFVEATVNSGIKQNASQSNVSIFPNPGNGKGIVLFPSKWEGPVNFRTFDISGREIQSGFITQNSSMIDLSNHLPGLFFLEFNTPSKREIIPYILIFD